MAPNLANDSSVQRAVAPAWHTVVLLLILFGFSFASAHTGGLTPFGSKIGRAFGYIVIIIFEWAVVAFIWFGARQRGIRMADLVGGSWARPIHIVRDIAIAIAFLIVSAGVLSGLDYFLKTAPNQAIRNLLPQGPIEVVLFLATSLTAGFCEELIYRARVAGRSHRNSSRSCAALTFPCRAPRAFHSGIRDPVSAILRSALNSQLSTINFSRRIVRR
ncbi:MAG: hypothetical protein DME20_12640 [Verrucomicrobia bacterium]|nr:MAG: hypothetical protein DME20_12640 [Verrucomicrobiota bacterium]